MPCTWTGLQHLESENHRNGTIHISVIVLISDKSIRFGLLNYELVEDEVVYQARTTCIICAINEIIGKWMRKIHH